MSEVLTRVYALQQAEKNRKLQEARKHQEKIEREIRAFVESPVCQTLMACKDMPLKSNASYNLASLMVYDREKVFEGRANNVYFSNGSSGIRWCCQEDRDSGVMLYTGPEGISERTANGAFLTSFIEFLAHRLKPEAVEAALAAAADKQEQEPNRRRIQPV
jgi:hypothetical protein